MKERKIVFEITEEEVKMIDRAVGCKTDIDNPEAIVCNLHRFIADINLLLDALNEYILEEGLI